MKLFLSLLIFLSFDLRADSSTISGKILPATGCANKAMVWLALDKPNYQDRLLLLHTEVPQGGTFEFYVKPGHYEVRVTDDEGCEYLKKLSIKNSSQYLEIQRGRK